MTTFSLRLRFNGTRHTIRLGTEAEGWGHVRAELELRNVQAQMRAGTWTPPKPVTSVDNPTLHEFASQWFRRKVGDGIAEKTQARSLLAARRAHPAVPRRRPSSEKSTRDGVEALKEYKLDERSRILAARAAGQPIRDRRGHPRRTLSNGSINKLLILLNTILGNAVRRGLIETNPPRTSSGSRPAAVRATCLRPTSLSP